MTPSWPGLDQATRHTRGALYLNARDNSHRRATGNQFNVFKAAAGLSIMHANYSPLNISSYVANIATYNWSHYGNEYFAYKGWWRGPTVNGPGSHDNQRSAGDSPRGINAFSKKSTPFLLIPGVIGEILKFCKTKQQTQKTGS